jgi:hypothetical protein
MAIDHSFPTYTDENINTCHHTHTFTRTRGDAAGDVLSMFELMHGAGLNLVCMHMPGRRNPFIAGTKGARAVGYPSGQACEGGTAVQSEAEVKAADASVEDAKWYVLLELSGGTEAGSLRSVAESLLTAAAEEGIVTDVVNTSHL